VETPVITGSSVGIGAAGEKTEVKTGEIPLAMLMGQICEKAGQKKGGWTLGRCGGSMGSEKGAIAAE